MKKCPDCLAHYSEDVEHTCPVWLKKLVDIQKEKGISFCSSCFCMTKSILGKCGKCGKKK